MLSYAGTSAAPAGGEARTWRGGAWEPDPELRITQNIVPTGTELMQAWFKNGHCQVCLGCLAGLSMGTSITPHRVGGSKRISRDLVCAQQNPRPCVQRRVETRRGRMRG